MEVKKFFVKDLEYENPFDIRFGFPFQKYIYNLFKNHGQDCLFSLAMEDVGVLNVDRDLRINFERFGVYVNENGMFSFDKQYLLILTEEDMESSESIQNAVSRFKDRYGKEVCDVVIEKNYSNVAMITSDNTKLRSVLPNVMVFNEGFYYLENKVSAEHFFKDVEYCDIFDSFRGYDVFSKDLSFIIKNARSMFEKLQSLKDRKVIFECGSTDNVLISNQSLTPLVSSTAAYCALKYRMLFDFSDKYDTYFLQYGGRFVQKNYNFLDKYLQLMSNPIDCGFRFRDGRAYLYLRNRSLHESQPKKYSISLSVCYLSFDSSRKSFVNHDFQMQYVDLRSIEVMSLENLFGIDSSDWNTALKGMHELNAVYSEFEEAYQESQGVITIPLNVSNTLLFRIGNTVCFGYVFKISGIVPYRVLSLEKGSRDFHDELSLDEVPLIYDFRLALDGVYWEKSVRSRYSKICDVTNLHWRLPETAKGIYLESLISVPGHVKEDVGATIAEIGLWSAVSSQYRNVPINDLIRYVTLKHARKINLLTCFGGPHPAITTNIRVVAGGWEQ